MAALFSQDQQYIAFVRNHATAVLAEGHSGEQAGDDWNACFGGEAHLLEDTFAGADEGLTKTNIENAQNVLVGLNIWLDEGGYNRRAYLMAVCFQPGR